MTELHWEILDEHRKGLLPRLAVFKDRFYLAGGTAVALYLGHRDSIDFDFFSPKGFDYRDISAEIKKAFDGMKIEETTAKPDTLIMTVDGVSMSFFKLDEPMIESFTDAGHLKLASLADIGCMKLGAILSRYVLKDYIDLYAICKSPIPLDQLLEKAKVKYPQVDTGAFLKAITYYADIQTSSIIFKNDFHADLEGIEIFFNAEVKKILM